jgi:hypothetical protein
MVGLGRRCTGAPGTERSQIGYFVGDDDAEV